MKKTILFKVAYKTINKRVILLFTLLSLSLLSEAQLSGETKTFSFTSELTDKYELTSFICRNCEGKVYSMWTVLEPANDCIYVLERSSNQKTFEILYSKKGGKSPGRIELLNSFVDKCPLPGISYYRVRRLTKDENIISMAYVVNSGK